jgi:septum formation protein
MKLILASASSRRRDLLITLGHDVLVVPPDVIEVMDDSSGINNISLINAKMKAQQVYHSAGLKDRDFIMGADTVVRCDHQVFGKPKNSDDAKSILAFLSNKVHEVTTSYNLIGRNGREISRSVVSLVEFRHLLGREIDAYLSLDEWQDKAGAYGIQGYGAALIRGVSGSLTNVIGLPIEEFLDDGRKLIEHREKFRGDKN